MQKEELIRDSQYECERSYLPNLLVFEEASKKVNESRAVDVIYMDFNKAYIDFNKAFDKILHGRLLEKIQENYYWSHCWLKVESRRQQWKVVSHCWAIANDLGENVQQVGKFADGIK